MGAPSGDARRRNKGGQLVRCWTRSLPAQGDVQSPGIAQGHLNEKLTVRLPIHPHAILRLALGARHISATPGELRVATGALPMNDSYTLFDAMAAYDVGAWRLSLNVTNLADKRYKTQCNTFRGGAQFCALGFGREVRVAAAYRF